MCSPCGRNGFAPAGGAVPSLQSAQLNHNRFNCGVTAGGSSHFNPIEPRATRALDQALQFELEPGPTALAAHPVQLLGSGGAQFILLNQDSAGIRMPAPRLRSDGSDTASWRIGFFHD